MTLRSLTIGDCDHYASPYMRGVAQAMQILEHPHAEVSIRSSVKEIAQRVRLWAPDVIWTHMALWPPPGSPPVAQLEQLFRDAKQRGARVVIHDGDAKQPTRHARDISTWCALALVNHGYDRSAWKVPVLHWPYFAMHQQRVAPPLARWTCDLFFAGTVGREPVYGARSRLLEAIRARGVDLKIPGPEENTIGLTAEIAASAKAVLGFGRPEVPGWVDTRVFQYPGAGGVLLHDDVRGYLEPWIQYVPYKSGDADSVTAALARLASMTEADRIALRLSAFRHVQAEHSSVARVTLALETLGLA